VAIAKRFVVAFLLATAWSSTTPADFLYFRRGGAAQLPIHREGDTVVVHAPSGPIAFAPEDFRAIVPGGDPLAEWPSRRDASRGQGPDARLAAAWWALENGLTPEATAALRDLHASDPSHEPTATLVRALDSVVPPLPDPDLSGLKSALGGTFREATSAHFVLLHQGDDAEARSRLDLLERVYATFYLVFAGHGFALTPPSAKLPAAVYARRSDYLAFLDREGARAFATAHGYYHPTRRVVVSSDPRDHPAYLRRSMEIRPGRDAARLALLLDLERLSIDLGLAAHEATHQFVAASGLAPRPDAFPTWLHEGLAMQFEVIRGGRWAGVGRANDLRLPDYRAIRPAPRLAPIARDAEFGHGYRRDLYAEAWALVDFLRRDRPSEFSRFLDLLRAPPDGQSSDARAFASFRTCFGPDVSTLEAEWHRALREVQAPLERADPSRIRPGRD
jgi:hypothetical protein